MTRYFAYGSNMSQEDLNRHFKKHYHYIWVPRRPVIAVLKDYRLDFNFYSESRKGGAANIVESPGDSVIGLLFEVDDQEFKVLARKEGAPDRYGEIDIQVTADGGTVDAKTFKVLKKHETEFEKPTADYMALLIGAAEAEGFPGWYIEKLRSVPVT